MLHLYSVYSYGNNPATINGIFFYFLSKILYRYITSIKWWVILNYVYHMEIMDKKNTEKLIVKVVFLTGNR